MPHDPALDFIEIEGQKHFFGNGRPKKSVRMPMRALPRIEDVKIEEFDISEDVPFECLDQNGRGACNGFAAIEAMMLKMWLDGMTFILLSAWYTYGRLCRGIDQGSSIAEALIDLSKHGTCRDSLVPYGTINPRSFSQEAKADAGNFRVEVGANLPDFNSHLIAATLRKPYNFSLDGNQMGGVDANGSIGTSPGVGNHALSGGYGLRKFKGKWQAKGRNHWYRRPGEPWGLNGYFWYGESNIRGQNWYDGYCLESVLDVPNDPTNIPKRKSAGKSS